MMKQVRWSMVYYSRTATRWFCRSKCDKSEQAQRAQHHPANNGDRSDEMSGGDAEVHNSIWCARDTGSRRARAPRFRNRRGWTVRYSVGSGSDLKDRTVPIFIELR